MKMIPFKTVFAIVALLMLIGVMSHSPVIAQQTNHYTFNITNRTSDKVNCQKITYALYLTDTDKRSDNVYQKTWNPGQTHVGRYGIAKAVKKCGFAAYCVCVADGWPRDFVMEFEDCWDINASFQLDGSGKCILTRP